MREFRERQKTKKMLYSAPVVLLLFILLIFVLKGNWGAFQKVRASKAALEESEIRYETMISKKESIEEDIAHLETETGVEEELRVQFNVSKEGENTIVIVDEEEEEIVVPEDKGFWKSAISWFKD